MTYRDLTTPEDFAAVVDLERRIWGPGYSDVVPAPILIVTVMRGGILVGAFEDTRLVGFVYSLAGLRAGKPMHWSHMLGVLEGFRDRGVGRQLKLLQRDRVIAQGLDRIEWTFDPMQALNAHLNFAKLGAVAEVYEPNVYGDSQSPLHRGNPTDRLIAEWHIREPHVERRLAASPVAVRSDEFANVARLNHAKPSGELPECERIDLGVDARRVAVEIPMGFTTMLAQAPDLARAWRMSTRLIFTTYFSRGYRAVDFTLDRATRTGAYLLVREP